MSWLAVSHLLFRRAADTPPLIAMTSNNNVTQQRIFRRYVSKTEVLQHSTSILVESTLTSASTSTTGHNKQTFQLFNFHKICQEVLEKWMRAEAQSPRGSPTQAQYCSFTYADA